MFRYRAHGLSVDSDIELPAFASSSNPIAEPVDITVVSGWPDGSAPMGASGAAESAPEPVSALLSETTTPGRHLCTRRYADGSVHVSGEGIELCIDPELSTLWARSDGTTEADAALPWFVGGLGLAVVMTLRGELVVHATVFEFDGRGHVIVAPSGHGKSLAASAACAGGAVLVAEDTVRLLLDGEGGCRALAGSTVLRSRRSHAEMSHWFDADRLSTSSDGRVLVRFESALHDVRVEEIHVLVLESDAESDSVAPLTDASALMSLLAHIRVPGLLPGELLDRQFDLLGDVVERVRVNLTRLRWTDSVEGGGVDGPDRAELPDRLIELLADRPPLGFESR